MERADHGDAVSLRSLGKCFDESAKALLVVHVFRSVQSDEEEILRLKAKSGQDVASLDGRPMTVDDLFDRIAGHVNPVAGEALFDEILFASIGVGHQDRAGVVDDPAVYLLRYPIVEA